jgi:hypothetical protein
MNTVQNPNVVGPAKQDAGSGRSLLDGASSFSSSKQNLGLLKLISGPDLLTRSVLGLNLAPSRPHQELSAEGITGLSALY